MNENKELLEYHCSNCGNRVNREDTKCPSCGAELEGFIDDEIDSDMFTYEDESVLEQSKVQDFFCAVCGTQINKEATICPKCGTKFDSSGNDESDITVELKKYTK